MKRKKNKLMEWLWFIIPAVVLLGGGIYFFSQIEEGPESGVEIEQASPVEMKAPEKKKPEVKVVQAGPVSDSGHFETATSPSGIAQPEKASESRLENDISDFFFSLNKEDYIQKLDPKIDTYDRFQKILKRLTLNPPVPSAEVNHPGVMLRNISYFFRTLDSKDLRLTKAVIANEQDNMETDLKMFYQWLTQGGGPPGLESIRPTRDVQYQFAGFFLNTIGGRGYLFRRAYKVRLLATYYSVLILHESDELGKNVYGIDVAPFVRQLNEEMKQYPGFQNYKEYVDELSRIEKYYMKRR